MVFNAIILIVIVQTPPIIPKGVKGVTIILVIVLPMVISVFGKTEGVCVL